MERGNVLVLGNLGAGKTTLINAVLGEEIVVSRYRNKKNDKPLEIYDSKEIPFRITEAVGFDSSFLKNRSATKTLEKWSKESIEEGNQIDVIWFCVDAASSASKPEAVKNLLRATKMWESIPIITVITKSYAVPERLSNIALIQSAFADEGIFEDRMKNIIPVVSATYILNETAFASPEGVTELIDATNILIPEGKQAAITDVSNFNLKRKKVLARSIVGISTAGAVTVGAVPIPIADALILTPIEIGLVSALARLYGIDKSDKSNEFLKKIVEVGTVSLVAKKAISMLKAIPGIRIGASVLNAIIAGSIVATIGEGSIYAFEKIYKGEESVADIEWITNVIENQFSSQFMEKVTNIIEQVASSEDKDLSSLISTLLTTAFSQDEETEEVKT